MDIDLGFTAIPAIAVICYLGGRIVKTSPVDNKWIPIICMLLDAVLGILGMVSMPEFPAHDYITALAIGIVSGLSSTGIHQAVKQIKVN